MTPQIDTRTPLKYHSAKEVAQALGVSERTVWRWVKQGRFPKPLRISEGVTRWRNTDFEKWDLSQGGAA